ncbi:MAG: nicotinate-nucleotide adenylyltransferase [Sedimentibacter sp.]
MKNRKVGIMGGTFDPIHMGHLVVANEVLNMYKLDEIIFIPAGNPPHKTGILASTQDRYLMTVMAALSNQRFSVSDIEIKNPDKSYTLNTLRILMNLYKDTEFYFITGADAVVELPNWHEPEKLLNMCKFIAVSRPGVSKEEVESRIMEIRNKYNGDIELLQVPMLQISSTDIRNRFKKGVSAKYMLPEAVEYYIIKNKLYLENNNDF